MNNEMIQWKREGLYGRIGTTYLLASVWNNLSNLAPGDNFGYVDNICPTITFVLPSSHKDVGASSLSIELMPK